MAKQFTRDSFVQNLARGQLIAPYLERFADFDEEWSFTYTPKEQDDAWHPSGDCVPSVAALYAKATGKTQREEFSAKTQRNFIVGHFWHALLQHIICNKLEFCSPDAIEVRGSHVWGPKLELDLRFEPAVAYGAPYHWATGSGDICPLELPNGWRGVFDIKTMAGQVWQRAWKHAVLPSGFDIKYECQVNIYMDFFNQERALLLGVNKDNPHGFVEFEFERNQELIDTIYAKWEYVSFCMDEGVEPDPEADEAFVLPLTGPIG